MSPVTVALAWTPDAVALLSAPVAFACEPWPDEEAVAVPCRTRNSPLVDTAMFCPGALGFADDEDAADDVPDEEDELGSAGLAHATHGDAAIPIPRPNATAKAPNRPM